MNESRGCMSKLTRNIHPVDPNTHPKALPYVEYANQNVEESM